MRWRWPHCSQQPDVPVSNIFGGMEEPCLAKRRPRDAMKRRGDLGSPWRSWAKSSSGSIGASKEASQKPRGLSFLSSIVQRLPRGLLLGRSFFIYCWGALQRLLWQAAQWPLGWTGQLQPQTCLYFGTAFKASTWPQFPPLCWNRNTSSTPRNTSSASQKRC